MFLKSFLLTFWMCSRHLEDPPNLDICVIQKNRVRTTHRHQIDHMPGKVKKVEILKNEAQNEAGIF